MTGLPIVHACRACVSHILAAYAACRLLRVLPEEGFVDADRAVKRGGPLLSTISINMLVTYYIPGDQRISQERKAMVAIIVRK